MKKNIYFNIFIKISKAYNEFIRLFHQSSRGPNLQIFLANICYEFIFNWQTEKKKIVKLSCAVSLLFSA